MKKSSLTKITKAIELEIEAFGEVMDVSKFKELQVQLEKFLIRDAVTLTLNRWKFEDVLKREIKRAKGNNTSLCLLMLDIDNFKRINDGLGHNEGDQILRTLAWDFEYIVEDNIGESHRFGRWGGDEFLYIFPASTPQEVKVFSEKLIEKIEDRYMEHSIACRIGISFGIANLKKSDDSSSFIKRADKAMYKAKKKGGNRIEVAK